MRGLRGGGGACGVKAEKAEMMKAWLKMAASRMSQLSGQSANGMKGINVKAGVVISSDSQ